MLLSNRFFFREGNLILIILFQGDAVLKPNRYQSMSSPLTKNSIEDWSIKQLERDRYDKLFQSLNPVNGFLPGDKVKGVLMDSKLPLKTLGKIWDLADVDKDGMLSQYEFVIVSVTFFFKIFIIFLKKGYTDSVCICLVFGLIMKIENFLISLNKGRGHPLFFSHISINNSVNFVKLIRFTNYIYLLTLKFNHFENN